MPSTHVPNSVQTPLYTKRWLSIVRYTVLPCSPDAISHFTAALTTSGLRNAIRRVLVAFLSSGVCPRAYKFPGDDRSTTFALSSTSYCPQRDCTACHTPEWEYAPRMPRKTQTSLVRTRKVPPCQWGSQRVSVSSSAKDAMSLSSRSLASCQKVPTLLLATQR